MARRPQQSGTEDTIPKALERHDTLMRAAIEKHDGRVFKTVGDAFCAVFESAQDGLLAAIEAQQRIVSENWDEHGQGFEPLQVRMGLHSGETSERDEDYFGPAVNRVARIDPADPDTTSRCRTAPE